MQVTWKPDLSILSIFEVGLCFKSKQVILQFRLITYTKTRHKDNTLFYKVSYFIIIMKLPIEFGVKLPKKQKNHQCINNHKVACQVSDNQSKLSFQTRIIIIFIPGKFDNIYKILLKITFHYSNKQSNLLSNVLTQKLSQ